ncbi:MAG TPA: ATP-binding protein [Solirubrobacterales bacterium]
MPGVTELNPFNFSRPAPADELINREQELTELLRLAEANSNSRLTAPRRYGKTTLLKRVREEAEKLGMNTVYVNFYGLLSVEEAANRIEDAYRTSLHGAVRNFVVGLIRTFRPKARIPKTGISVEPTLDTDVGRRLAWLLDLPVKIMERTANPTLVVFDEFQDILETKPPLDGLIRSRLEQHETQASYIFAGSHIGMMSRLFDDRARPFYGQAKAVRLEPLPEDALAIYIGDRFTKTRREVGEALELLLDTARGHPQRAMLLAHFLWEKTPKGKVSDGVAWERALTAVQNELRDEFDSIWGGLEDSERRVLVIVARGADLSKKGVLEEMQLARTTARDARDRLLAEGLIGEVEGESYVVDPLLGLWVSRNRRDLTDPITESPEF